ncbi:MAG TPA: transporter [Burkholderiaceae bacterium]|nr:transporter [Burkholderiaceae bacterium]
MLASALIQSAYAGHPLVTDDAFTQDKGNHQFEANSDRSWLQDDVSQSGSLTYAYGVERRVDLFVNVPFSFSTPTGMNDVAIGAKWRWFEDGALHLALKPELTLPSGDDDKGLGNGRANFGATLIGTYDATPWVWHGNLALRQNRYAAQADQDAQRTLLARISAAVWYVANDHWKLVADTGVMHNPDKNGADAMSYVLGGAIYSPHKDIDIDVGMKFGLGCRDCAAQARHQVGVGVTWRF